jgi:ubiquinone/menaquinone biosynthesis C-methylase UbiE
VTGQDYILRTGEAALSRLRLLERVYGTTTDLLLNEAGIKSGMHVADIGCGAGFTSCKLAKFVGPTGRVYAVDISADQLEIARNHAAQAGISNIDFIEDDAFHTRLPNESFDIVYSRLLLCHLRNAPDVLNEFKRLLKRGGTLICEDFIASQIFSIPESQAYIQLADMALRFSEKASVDYSIGRRLPQLIRSLGLAVLGIRMVQPAHFTGEEKRWWEYSVREAAPALLKTGFQSQAQLDALFSSLEAVALDPETLIAQPVMTQVWARRAV